MKNIVILCFAVLTYSIGFCQDLGNNSPLVDSGRINTYDRGDKTITRNPYLNETFSPAKVSIDDSKVFSIRYNLVSDEMEVNNEHSGILAINTNISNISITFLNDNKTYQVYNYLDIDGQSKKGFLVKLSNSNNSIQLLIKEAKKFVDSKPAKSSYQEATPATFKRVADKFYIKIGDDVAFELPKNKKEIAKLFPKSESNILSYIKKEKIKTSKKDDLIKLFSFINTL